MKKVGTGNFLVSSTSHLGYDGTNNYGFFIQNDSRTLDTAGEWYYNLSTKKIRIYSSISPTNVQVSTEEAVIPLS